MKYIIPERIVFKYLDLYYGDLEQHMPETYKGTVLKKPSDDSKYGVIGFQKGLLFIHYKLIDEISSMFSLKEFDSENIIRKWISDKYNSKFHTTIWVDEYSYVPRLKIK